MVDPPAARALEHVADLVTAVAVPVVVAALERPGAEMVELSGQTEDLIVDTQVDLSNRLVLL